MIALPEIRCASNRLKRIAVRTPLLSSMELDTRMRGKILFKTESLQITGSFKLRGAYNLMSQIPQDARKHGVVAWSSGNHAQGVAAAGQLLGLKTTLVMPKDAPRIKIGKTKALGGEVVFYDRITDDRESIARAIAERRRSTLVPSYDHDEIIAGQGTVGLELMQQCSELSLIPDQVIICCGGGGLSAGCSVAIKTLSPRTDIYIVEPEGYDDALRSLRSGVRESNKPNNPSICDALLAESTGLLTFRILKALVSDGLVVSDSDVRDAMRFAFNILNIVVEPSGAVALAAVLCDKISVADKVTVVILSGGNVDKRSFFSIVE